MKRTNKLLSTFWVKAVPVILLLACIGFTTAKAQNYKPLDEAMASVSTALDALKAEKGNATLNQGTPGSAKTNGMTPTQTADTHVKVFESSYFYRFLFLLKENQSVASAVQALDTEHPVNGSSLPSRNTTLTTSRNELMHLITY